MRVFGFALLVLLVAVMIVDATPAKSSSAKERKPKCDLVCTTDYTPVCAGIPNDKTVKPKLFGNKCVLEKHNCENKSNLEVISDEQCKNAGGVRLF